MCKMKKNRECSSELEQFFYEKHDGKKLQHITIKHTFILETGPEPPNNPLESFHAKVNRNRNKKETKRNNC